MAAFEARRKVQLFIFCLGVGWISATAASESKAIVSESKAIVSESKATVSENLQDTVRRELGDTQRILLVKKSVNPQNFMAVYTKVNSTCTFQEDSEHPGHAVFDFYWLMDGTRYKPVASLIKREIRKRLQALPLSSPNKFSILLNDLQEVSTDIPANSRRLDVTASRGEKGCIVKGVIKLGPATEPTPIQLNELYTDGSANILTRSVTVRSIKLTGVQVNTGKPVVQIYKGKP